MRCASFSADVGSGEIRLAAKSIRAANPLMVLADFPKSAGHSPSAVGLRGEFNGALSAGRSPTIAGSATPFPHAKQVLGSVKQAQAVELASWRVSKERTERVTRGGNA